MALGPALALAGLAAAAAFTQTPAWQTFCLSAEVCVPTTACQNRVDAGGWAVCLDHIDLTQCLVYSVGIADNWQFDEAMGRLGCEVHSFDPTVDLDTHLAPNVTFHKLGFKYTGIGETKLADAYSAVDGPLLSLEQVADQLGHRGRRLDVLKLDCEGCEWGVIQELSRPGPPLTGPDNLVLEVHLSREYGIKSMQDVQTVAQLFRYLFEPASGQPFQRFHYNENQGWDTHRSVIQPLVAAGMKPDSCCRELGFMRQPNATFTRHHSKIHRSGSAR